MLTHAAAGWGSRRRHYAGVLWETAQVSFQHQSEDSHVDSRERERLGFSAVFLKGAGFIEVLSRHLTHTRKEASPAVPL